MILIDHAADLLKKPQPAQYVKSLLVAIGQKGIAVLDIARIHQRSVLIRFRDIGKCL